MGDSEDGSIVFKKQPKRDYGEVAQNKKILEKAQPQLDAALKAADPNLRTSFEKALKQKPDQVIFLFGQFHDTSEEKLKVAALNLAKLILPNGNQDEIRKKEQELLELFTKKNPQVIIALDDALHDARRQVGAIEHEEAKTREERLAALVRMFQDEQAQKKEGHKVETGASVVAVADRIEENARISAEKAGKEYQKGSALKLRAKDLTRDSVVAAQMSNNKDYQKMETWKFIGEHLDKAYGVSLTATFLVELASLGVSVFSIAASISNIFGYGADFVSEFSMQKTRQDQAAIVTARLLQSQIQFFNNLKELIFDPVKKNEERILKERFNGSAKEELKLANKEFREEAQKTKDLFNQGLHNEPKFVSDFSENLTGALAIYAGLNPSQLHQAAELITNMNAGQMPNLRQLSPELLSVVLKQYRLTALEA